MHLDLESLTTFRKKLHAHPEVSQQEVGTQQMIREYVETFKPDQLIPVAKTGLLAIYHGKKPGKTVMLRADTDALPIQEINEFVHRSQNPGVSHKCGHDGHTTILCGVAQMLSQQRPESGQVALLFQPAEENGWGAEAVLNDPKFKSVHPDRVFALHNLPGYPLNEIVIKEGSFTAAAKSIIIFLDGKTAHAAEPEKGINPALAMAEIILMMENLCQKDINQEDFALVTPIHFAMGEKAYGISAGHAQMHFTFRTWQNQRMDELCEEAVTQLTNIAAKHQLKLTIDWTESFRANQNHPETVDIVRTATKESELKLTERSVPFKWGEDFGLFTEHFKGAMFGIGAGTDIPALHNPDYDFPDAIIEPSVRVFYRIILNTLKP